MKKNYWMTLNDALIEIERLNALKDREWFSVLERVPPMTEEGVEVLIWPRNLGGPGVSGPSNAFYGARYQDEGGFYMYGAVLYPTHWMPLPKGPIK